MTKVLFAIAALLCSGPSLGLADEGLAFKIGERVLVNGHCDGTQAEGRCWAYGRVEAFYKGGPEDPLEGERVAVRLEDGGKLKWLEPDSLHQTSGCAKGFCVGSSVLSPSGPLRIIGIESERWGVFIVTAKGRRFAQSHEKFAATKGCINDVCVGNEVATVWRLGRKPDIVGYGKVVGILGHLDTDDYWLPEGGFLVLLRNGGYDLWPRRKVIGAPRGCGQRFCVGDRVTFKHKRTLWADHMHQARVEAIASRGRMIVTIGKHGADVVSESALKKP